MGTELPPQWRWTRIGEHFERVRRKNTAGVERVLTASGNDGLVDQEEFFNRRVAAAKIDHYYLLKRGEFAYNRSAMNGHPFGAIKRLVDYEEGALSTLYICFSLSSDTRVNADFAAYLFESGQLNRELSSICAVGARAHGLLNVTPSDFFEVSFQLPPLPEQRKIAAILSSVDDAIAATRQVIDQTQRVKQGLLETLTTRGIGHTRFKETEEGKIPEQWEACRLGDVLEGIEAGRSPAAIDEPATNGRWGVLKVSAIGNGVFLPDMNKTLPEGYRVEPRHTVKPGDVLISRANTAELVGATCRVPEGEFDLMLSDKTLRLRPNLNRITPGFLANLTNAPDARSYFAARATGSSASMKNLSQAKIRSLPIALPPLPEQMSIESVLAQVHTVHAEQRATAETLQRLKRGLFQDLLTGRVRVQPD